MASRNGYVWGVKLPADETVLTDRKDNTMNQKEGVFTAVMEVVGSDRVNQKVELSPSELMTVHAMLVEMFMAGLVDYRGGVQSREKIVKYVPGLVNNWLRKDLRLNGGSPYVTKNPGSRTGSGDPQLQALKILLGQTTNSEDRVAVQKAIEARLEELKPQSKELDISKIPEHLREVALRIAPKIVKTEN